MNDYRNVLERDLARVGPAPFDFDDVARRRDRKRRNQRITAGVVGIAVFVAAIWIVTSGGPLDRSETSVVPGGDVTGPAVTGGENPEPPLVEPAPIGTVTSSGGGCALEIDAEPIPAGAGRLTVVNETDRPVSFDLFRFDPEILTFGQFEEFIATSELYGRLRFDPPPGAFVLTEREVGPGASGTIVDNFTGGDVYAVVCAHPLHDIDIFTGAKKPIAVVGPIVVP